MSATVPDVPRHSHGDPLPAADAVLTLTGRQRGLIVSADLSGLVLSLR